MEVENVDDGTGEQCYKRRYPVYFGQMLFEFIIFSSLPVLTCQDHLQQFWQQEFKYMP